jgi:CheY-like chemotaxis protein
MTMNAHSKAWVIVVDDHEDGRELVQEFLSMRGYRVEGCSSAEEALAVFGSKGIPDAVLTDLNLGSMTGAEFARAIRTMPSAATLPILAMTGRAEFEDPDQLFDAVMIKPIEPSTLVASLDAALARRSS